VTGAGGQHRISGSGPLRTATMKFKADRAALLKALAHVQSVVENSS